MKWQKLPAGFRAFSLVLAGNISLLILMTVSVPAQAGLLEQARECTRETRRLERLACFDEVFGTPLAASPSNTGLEEGLRTAAVRSGRWNAAYKQAGSEAVAGAAVYRDTGRAAGLLVTVPALGAQPPRPLLALQCHNNITELALMLPEPLDVERLELGLGVDKTAATKAWRVRDEGYVLSIGRGLPAIRAVKMIALETDLRIYAENSRIDGLLFDLTGFNSAIRPLRERCGW
ncbi:type VI secretion system-associated protein TagO [Marinobacter adhaerens]|uniref:Type VI secretion system-associated protein TagO n=1 Tax=Marinobacter adhaerens TaxID=1033846 RepID=A0A851HK19_9GAMM|nr:type VI secretion system-associated protein VasI [Marinobacter adhaerens]NWN90179.1 type VI secretion system-associated protein TagO [Marinobacter adhaerens]